MARFEAARAFVENQSDDGRRVVALQERLSEVEQSSREMREQLYDELRIAETKLSVKYFMIFLIVNYVAF